MDFLQNEYAEEFKKRQEQIRAWYACDHTGQEQHRRRTIAGGTLCVYRQCAQCGANLNAVKKSSFHVEEIEAMPPYDEALQDERYREMTKKLEDLREGLLARQRAAQQARDSSWWNWYNQYLTSPEWRQKRAAVMSRADGICEGCGIGRASQVHHLTYKHVGNEFLFELAAVCDACHQRLHDDQAHDAA